MGRLGYKPWELHRITYREAYLSQVGLSEQNKYYHDLVRKATSLICASGMNHKIAQNFSNLWPVDRKKGSGKLSAAVMDQLFKLRNNQAIRSANKKIDARRSKTNS